MATLQELRKLFTDSDLLEKVEAATIISIQAKLGGTPTVDEQKYANHVFSNPKVEAKKALMSVLASNAGSTVSQIIGASDSAIQTNVDAVIDTLIVAFNAGLV